MATGRHYRQRRAVAVVRSTVLVSLSILGLLIGGCTRPRQESARTGWAQNGVALPSDSPITISPAADGLQLEVVFPDGFGPAEGFRQTATVTVPGEEAGQAIELAPEGGTPVPIPHVLQSTLTLSLGFCGVRDKETCYIDRPTVRITRDPEAGAARNLIVHYAPETPR